jgi:hypothetical protein
VVPAVLVVGELAGVVGELGVAVLGVVRLDVVLPAASGLAVPQAVASTARLASSAPAIVGRPMRCAEDTAIPLSKRPYEPCVIGMTLEGWRWLGRFRGKCEPLTLIHWLWNDLYA